VVKKILRSLPQRFQPKITAIEEIRDLNTLKVQELIGSIQTYEMKHLAPKKSENVAFKVVNEEDDGHSNEDCSDEELTILTRRFMNFLKNQDPRGRDSKGINSKNRFVNYTDSGSKFRRSNERKNPREKVQCFECEGYGHISSECANTLKKQKDGKNKAMHTTWSNSESECDNDEKTVALITTVSLDESHEDDDCKEVAVLKLENCRIANKFQSPDADFEKVSTGMYEKLMFLQKKLSVLNKLIASLNSDNKALELELKNSKERFVSLTI
ncbi:PREDICTED: zf-CCHC domain-containing, partial [Prunus dulcis]